MRWTLPIWFAGLLIGPVPSPADDDDVRQVLDIAVPMVSQAEEIRAQGDPAWEGILANALAMLRLAARDGAPPEAYLTLARAEALAGDDQAVADAYAGYLRICTAPEGPEAAQARAFLSEHHIRLGIEALVQEDTERAAESFRAALAYDPSNEMARARLVRLAGGMDPSGAFWLPPSGSTAESVSVPIHEAPQQCLERARAELAVQNWQAAHAYLAALKDLGRTDTLAASLTLASAGMAGVQASQDRQALERARDAGLLGGFIGLRAAVAAGPTDILRAAILFEEDIRAYGALNRAGAERTELVSAYAGERILVLLGGLSADARSISPVAYASLELSSADGVRVSPLPNRAWPVLVEFLGPELPSEGTLITFPATDAEGRPLMTPATESLTLLVRLGGAGDTLVALTWSLGARHDDGPFQAEATEPVEGAQPPSGVAVVEGPAEGPWPLQRLAPDEPGATEPIDEQPTPPAVVMADIQPEPDEDMSADAKLPTYVHTQGRGQTGEQPAVVEPSPSRPLGPLSGGTESADPARATPTVLVSELTTEDAVCDAFLPHVGRVVMIGKERGVALWFTEQYIEALLRVTTAPSERAQLRALQEATRNHLVFLVSVPEPEGEGALPLATRCVLQDAHANRRRGRELASVIENTPPTAGAPGQYICFAKSSRTQHTVETEIANQLELTVEIGRTIVPPRFVWELPLSQPRAEPRTTP